MLDTPLPQRRPLSRGDKAMIHWLELRAQGPAYPFRWARNKLRYALAARRPKAAPSAEAPVQFHDAAIEAAFYQAIAAYRVEAWDGPLTLFRPPLRGKYPVGQGRLISDERAYVLPDNDWHSSPPARGVRGAGRSRQHGAGTQCARPCRPSAAGDRSDRARGGTNPAKGRRMNLLTVILNWRTAEMTLRATEAALTAMEGIAGEITIVDNDSGDGSYEELSRAVAQRGWTRVRVLQSGRNGGFGAGNNVGIRAGLSHGGRPDLVYILNSDAFPAPDAIPALDRSSGAHPEAGFAGSYIHGTDGHPHLTSFRFPGSCRNSKGLRAWARSAGFWAVLRCDSDPRSHHPGRLAGRCQSDDAHLCAGPDRPV